MDTVIRSILLTNFAAIHTSSNVGITEYRKSTVTYSPLFSQSFTQALYTLAAHPECVGPLREEVDKVIREEGWTKIALQKLRKLDSFMRENQRVNGITSRECLLYHTCELITEVLAHFIQSVC